MKKTVTSMILSLLFFIYGMAQDIIVQGTVRDAFDNTGLENARVQILNSDSNAVALVSTEIPFTTKQSDNNHSYNYKDPNNGARFECMVPHGDYTAVVNMMGYETKRVSFHVPKGYKKKLEIGDIYLIPQPVSLEEVTVTGTKLKMYYNADTLVYNADAFVLDKRNILEDLVKMLPGVELRDGKVFANGRFVESIVISGKDVMPDNPMQLMKMLPAYIVDKLKFYDQQGEKSKTMGRDMLDASYVMDVCLKRDYHATWLGNVEAGGGSEERWEGLGFVMRFDDRQYFSISADANNIGREREKTDLCSIERLYEDRDLANHQLNLNYSYHPTDKFCFDVNAVARRQDTELGIDEKQKLPLSNSTDIYKLYGKTSDNINDYYKGGMSMSLRPRKGIYGSFSYSFIHGKDTEESTERSMTGLHDINFSDSVWQQIELMQTSAPLGITNMYTDSVFSSNRTYCHKVATEWHFALGGHLLKFKANYDMRHDDGETNQRYMNRVFDSESIGERHRNLYDTRVEDNKATVRIEYGINYIETAQKRGVLTPYYTFLHKKACDSREMFLFEPVGDGTETSRMDMNNSRKIKKRQDVHSIGLHWTHEMQLRQRGWLIFDGEMPVEVKDVNVRLVHETTSNLQHKKYILLSPTLEMKWHPKANDKRGNITSLNLKGWCSQVNPEAVYLLDQTDSSDPMNTYLGNPRLRKQTDLGCSLEWRHYFERNRHSTYATLSGTTTWNAIAVQSVYDKQDGTKTFMPVNVDGEHRISMECGYSLPLASNQTCWMDLSAGADYSRCTNMAFDNGGNQGFGHMKLYGHRARANIRWNNKSRKVEAGYTIAYTGNGIVANAESDDYLRQLSNNFSVTEHLPGGINASVNCNFISRFGYAMNSLNKTLVLTNAQISKSFYKEKLELCLSAMDIFHQRKHVHFAMDGEGHVETIATRYIPAYVLASVCFNWSYSPKKKN